MAPPQTKRRRYSNGETPQVSRQRASDYALALRILRERHAEEFEEIRREVSGEPT